VVLALSGVNTHPAQRGRGLGKLVVQAAWARLRELPVRGASAL
jgi:ribosomal protein S18 acetylase RimI-like enzyme